LRTTVQQEEGQRGRPKESSARGSIFGSFATRERDDGSTARAAVRRARRGRGVARKDRSLAAPARVTTRHRRMRIAVVRAPAAPTVRGARRRRGAAVARAGGRGGARRQCGGGFGRPVRRRREVRSYYDASHQRVGALHHQRESPRPHDGGRYGGGASAAARKRRRRNPGRLRVRGAPLARWASAWLTAGGGDAMAAVVSGRGGLLEVRAGASKHVATHIRIGRLHHCEEPSFVWPPRGAGRAMMRRIHRD